jgi:polysaccharide pyruvyl transferase WcaK-like protein
MRSKADYLLVGHFRGPNLGDEAMLLALLNVLTELGACATVSTKDGRLGAEHIGAFRRSHKRGVLRELRSLMRCDGLILGGGSHYHDGYSGTLRSAYHFASMTRYVLLIVAARILGRRVLLLGVGFGPIHRPTTVLLTKVAVNLSHEVVVRDAASAACLKEHCVSSHISVGFDLAALLRPIVVTRCKTVAIDNSVLVVGIAPTEMFNRPTTEEPWSTVIKGVAAFGQTSELVIRCYTCNEGKSPDTPLVERLINQAQVLGQHAVIERYAERPLAAMLSIGECDLFVASRYHGAVLAYLMDVPLVILPYHRKLKDLAGEIGIPDLAIISEGDTPGTIQARLQGVLEGRVSSYTKSPDAAVASAAESAHALRRQDGRR